MCLLHAYDITLEPVVMWSLVKAQMVHKSGNLGFFLYFQEALFSPNSFRSILLPVHCTEFRFDPHKRSLAVYTEVNTNPCNTLHWNEGGSVCCCWGSLSPGLWGAFWECNPFVGQIHLMAVKPSSFSAWGLTGRLLWFIPHINWENGLKISAKVWLLSFSMSWSFVKLTCETTQPSRFSPAFHHSFRWLWKHLFRMWV